MATRNLKPGVSKSGKEMVVSGSKPSARGSKRHPSESTDSVYVTTFRITVGIHAALINAAELLKEREGHSKPDASLVLRRVLREWIKKGSKVPGP
ncbi:MAG TPA: hypothetical protein VMK42_11930 [Anaeromyxobacteraceae bacterium]|nr:hypothetical protein [Anaeromyxobacteraceae bacterium]